MYKHKQKQKKILSEKYMLLLCLAFFCLPNIADGNSDYYDYAEDHDDWDYDGQYCPLKKSKFPQKTLEEIFGQNVQTCCDFHGYIHKLKEEWHVRFSELSKQITQFPILSNCFSPIDLWISKRQLSKSS